MSELDTITARFGRAYTKRDKAQTSLKRQQEKMFSAFSSAVAKRSLGRRSVRYPVGADLTTWIKQHHPGYRSVDASDNGEWIILEQDPAYVKFTYVNPETQTVYGRTVAEGSPSLDDEALRTDQPELWERISVWPEPWFSIVRNLIRDFISLPWKEEALDDAAGRYLAQAGLQKVLKDFNGLTDEDLMKLEDYLIPGPLTIRLLPPRPAKPDELETADND